MKGRKLPRYVSRFVDARGRIRYRIRHPKLGIDAYLQADPFSAAGRKEYEDLMQGGSAPSARGSPVGTIAHLAEQYRASSEWRRKRASTRKNWHSTLEKLVGNLGTERVKDLDRARAERILNQMADAPTARDNFRKRMHALWNWGNSVGLASTNPWHGIRSIAPETDGFLAWTEEDVAAFTRRFPIGTKEHFAMTLMLNTFARRSDLVRLGRSNIVGSRIIFSAEKNSVKVDIPILPELAAALKLQDLSAPRLVMTQFGKPYTVDGFGGWFARKCEAAGVKARAHGLRKLAAIRMAYAGATVPQLMAWGGWKTQTEPLRYIQQAQRARLADKAAQQLSNAQRKNRQKSR